MAAAITVGRPGGPALLGGNAGKSGQPTITFGYNTAVTLTITAISWPFPCPIPNLKRVHLP